LWKILSSKLGMDITVGVSLPVWLFEPLTALQRSTEMIEFPDLLNQADEFESSLDKMAFAAAFSISSYNGTERFGKPFNPLLGETFENIDKQNEVKFFAEQISHHPPITASHAISPHFTFWQDSRVKTKLLGNSVEINTQGKTHIYFPKSRDHFVYSNPTSRVYNLIIGSLWIDHFGEVNMTNLRTKDTCIVTFQKCGWLGKGRYEVAGQIKDSQGTPCLSVQGKWNESVTITWLYDQGKFPKGTSLCVWKRPEINAIGKYKLTKFAMKLNDIDEDYEKLLPTTDSRLRPDRRLFEKGDLGTAAAAKGKLEERQRIDKRVRTENKQEWRPRWFKEIMEQDGSTIWVYCGDYWEQRQQKEQLLKNPESNLDIDPQKLLGTKFNEGLACDFRSYKDDF